MWTRALWTCIYPVIYPVQVQLFHVFLCAPSCAVLNQVMPLLLNFGPFSHSTNLLLICVLYFCRQSHLPSADAFFFSRFYEFFFSRFSRFFEILQDFRYFSFLFLSSRVKNHICILWNPNICFNNNNNLLSIYHSSKNLNYQRTPHLKIEQIFIIFHQ